MRRLVTILLLLTIPVWIAFGIWGDWWEKKFTLEGSVEWLRAQGSWGGAAGFGLLVADIALPVPATLVMSALGVIHGWLGGALISLAGGVSAGLTGYAIGRLLPEKTARKWLGAEGWEESRDLFDRVGPWAVAASRALPVFPEAISCLAGIARMSLAKFLPALLLGSAPMALIFALIGHLGRGNPVLALIASVAIPPLFWFAGRRLLNRPKRAADSPSPHGES